ncbi:MAG: tetratricopeptide repeat protein [Treponema sp.]|nr:tetratricopeptide repeat protein [Treponema sp.]
MDNLLLSRAQAAVLANDFQLAYRLFKNILKQNPNDITILSQLGNMYVKSGHDEKALPIFDKVLSIDEKNLNAFNNLGAIYRREKKYDESVSILKKALEIYNDNSQVEYNLGFTYKIMGEYDKAIECFEDVIDKNPSDVLAYNHIGSIYAERKDYESAVQTYQRALKIDPNHPIIHFNLAKTFEALNKKEEALFEYENALRSKPGWLEAINGYADLLMKVYRTKDAGAVVMQAVRLNPDNANMHSKLGNIFSEEDKNQDAEEEYRAALSINKDFKPALSGLANVYEKQGKYSEAVNTMSYLESLNPEDLDVQKQYSGILLSAKELDKAKAKIDLLCSKNKDDPHALNLLGQYYVCTGNLSKAHSCYDRIEKLDPYYKEYLKDGALRMTQQELFEDAEVMEKEYLAVHPEDPKAISFLGQLYEEQNRFGEALELYKHSLNLFNDNDKYKDNVSRLSKQLNSEEKDTVSDLTAESANEEGSFSNENLISSVDEIADDIIAESSTAETEVKDSENIPETDEDDSEEKTNLVEDMNDILALDDITDFDFSELQKSGEFADNNSSVSLWPVFSDEEEPIDVDSEEEEAIVYNEDIPEDKSNGDINIKGLENDTDALNNADSFDKEDEEAIKHEESSDLACNKEPESKEESNDEALASVETFSDAEKQDNLPYQDIIDDYEDSQNDTDNSLVDDFSTDEEDENSKEADLQTALDDSFDYFGASEAKENKDEILSPELKNEEDEEENSYSESDKDFFTDTASEDVNNYDNNQIIDNESVENVTSILKSLSRKDESVMELFEGLKHLAESLPEDKKQDFLSSRTRMLMDYIISKLKQNKGLLQTALELRDNIGLKNTESLNNCKSFNSQDDIQLVKEVLEYMISLAQNLPDTALATSLIREAQAMMSKLY